MRTTLNRTRHAAPFLGAALALLVFAAPARAEFPPEGAVADPNNPSKADKISVSHVGKMTIKSIDHYYFDCLKKKWVWVSRDLWRQEGNGEDEHVSPGHWTKDEKFVPGADPGHSDLDPSPKPPGATKPGDTPDEAFDPKTSTTYKYDREKDQWIDKFTGHVVSHKLCPPCPPCPERSDSSGGLNLGIGIGVGVGGHSGGHHGKSHRSGCGHGKTTSSPKEDDGASKSGGCGHGGASDRSSEHGDERDDKSDKKDD